MEELKVVVEFDVTASLTGPKSALLVLEILITLDSPIAFAVLAVVSYLKTLLDDAVDVTDDGVGDTVAATVVGAGPVASLVVLPRFLLANSYISPNIPAKVRRKFFIVSSVSSPTDGWGWGAAGRCALVRELFDDWESRRALLKVGARSVGCSGTSDETLPTLPCRPIEPGPGVDLSGIGGGAPLIEDPRE